jgi:hypothetical protein
MCQISTDTFTFKSSSNTAALTRKDIASSASLTLHTATQEQTTTFKPSTYTSVLSWCSYVLLSILTLGDPVSTQNIITCITITTQSITYYPQAWFTASYAPTGFN